MKKQVCEFLELPLVEIGSNPRNPRKGFAGPKFDELGASVKEKGVIEPIIVRPVSLAGMKYQIVAGERRFRAAEKASHETIPAIIRQLAILGLPANILEAWRKGRLRYGHLEELLRVKEQPAWLKEFFKLASQTDRWDGPTTGQGLKER